MKNKNNSQAGSLVEILVIVALLTFLSGGALQLFMVGSDSYVVNKNRIAARTSQIY